MFLSMDINTTMFRSRLLEAGFTEETTDRIMNICYSSEVEVDWNEE